MTIEIDRTRTYTVKEFLALPEDEAAHQFELIEGVLTEMPGPNLNHGLITTRLVLAIGSYLSDKALGQVLTNLAFVLDDKNAPMPDVAFVEADRLKVASRETAFEGAPDLAIEVMSPTDKWSDVSRKVHLYQQRGSKLVWVIDPFDQGVTVYHHERPRRLLLIDDKLDGEDVISGFSLEIKTLFDL